MKTIYKTDESGLEKKIDDADKKIPDIRSLKSKITELTQILRSLRLKVKT